MRGKKQHLIGVLTAAFVAMLAPRARAQSDSFGGTAINTVAWQIATPGTSTVQENSGLIVFSDGTGSSNEFPNMPGSFAPGAGVGANRALSGDFDVQVSFRGFSGPPNVNFTQVFLTLYQDSTHMIHIKRIIGNGLDGIQTVWINSGPTTGTAVTAFPGNSSGKFRIARQGAVITTYFDSGDGTGFHVDLPGTSLFSGNVLTSLLLLAPSGNSASVTFSDYLINAGSLVCPFLPVSIQVKPPATAPVSINLSSAGVVPVAILSTPTFDATTVDPASVTLAGAKVTLIGKSDKFSCSAQDVNGDGLLDLVCQVTTAQFLIQPGNSLVMLEAQTTSGQQIRGEEAITIVPQ